MIHHISLSVQNPQHVAQVLAEAINGQAFPFFPHPGSYMVFPLDEHGTGIELYPLKTQLIPGEGDNQCMFAIKSYSFWVYGYSCSNLSFFYSRKN